MTVTLALVAVMLVTGLVNGWMWGYASGKAYADRVHDACHAAQKQVRDAFLASVVEHADIEAWEEEL